LDLCPPLRRRARRATIEIRRLVEALVAAFPDAAVIAHEPGLADYMDTTPYDHVAADVVAHARALSAAIAALADPP
jgi:hypothetical protein